MTFQRRSPHPRQKQKKPEPGDTHEAHRAHEPGDSMTDQQAGSALERRVIEGVVVLPTCTAQAASCFCIKDEGHVEAGDPVHMCDPSECTGQWCGDLDTGVGFKIVEFPMAVQR